MSRKILLALVVGIWVLGCRFQAHAQTQSPTEARKGVSPSDLAAIDHLLTTTRTVRKRLDLTRPVEPEVIEKAIEIALQAPTGSNMQNWHFVVVTDPDKKKAIADLYRKSAEEAAKRPRSQYATDDPRAKQAAKIAESGAYLRQHLHEVPALVIACIEGRFEQEPQFVQASTYGSILPAAWSFMLALRARGVGSAWTTLHLRYEKEVAKILGMPENITQAVMFPVAYYKGTDFKPAQRLPAREHTHWNTWGQQR
jgi:nitroreductase